MGLVIRTETRQIACPTYNLERFTTHEQRKADKIALNRFFHQTTSEAISFLNCYRFHGKKDGREKVQKAVEDALEHAKATTPSSNASFLLFQKLSKQPTAAANNPQENPKEEQLITPLEPKPTLNNRPTNNARNNTGAGTKPGSPIRESGTGPRTFLQRNYYDLLGRITRGK